MSKELIYFLQKIKYSDVNAQYVILKNIAVLIKNATRNDLLCLLDVINTTRNIELQIHMVSLCCIYLLSNGENIDIFITCNLLYASMENILSKHLPCKTSVVLNFLTLLLHADCTGFATRKQSLIMHARNMIRTSGCLASMTDFFIRGMMYQDTWKALCQCLAEICSNCESNQSNCTHLIPKCIQVCSQGNVDVPPLLFHLLHNHERNIQMFVRTNGMSLFSRNLLQYCPYLQLLVSVVQTSKQAAIIAQKSSIFVYVQEILKTHGPYSQMGQWATVILYHADSIVKETKQIDGNIETEFATKTNKNDRNMDGRPDCDNTTQLFHNILKEIIQWKPRTDIPHTDSTTVQNKTRNYNKRYTIGNDRQILFANHKQLQKSMYESRVTSFTLQSKMNRQVNDHNDLTFSFLKDFEENVMRNGKNNHKAKDTTKEINSDDSLYCFNKKTNIDNTCLDTTREQSIFHVKNKQYDDISILSIKHFKPELMSTPKKKIDRFKDTTRENTRRNEFSTLKSKPQKSNRLICNKKPRPIVNKELKNKSLGSRLFNVINDSYMNVVSKVKNIFKSNKNSTVDKSVIFHSKSQVKEEDVCNYSFTKYMHERDAQSSRNRNNLTRKNINAIADLCRTCNDTRELKQKMKNNKYLRHTIQKLTLGINLYGCDFKKISDVMWPQESYMTPKVLYNLYCKLIRK